MLKLFDNKNDRLKTFATVLSELSPSIPFPNSFSPSLAAIKNRMLKAKAIQNSKSQ